MNVPYKIVFLITDLDTGGAEIMLLRLLSYLDRGKFDPTVICLSRDGPLGEKIRSLNIPVVSLRINPANPDPLAWFQLLKYLRQVRPVLLHTWMYHSDFFGGLAGFLLKIPVVWAIHNSTTNSQFTRKRTLLIIHLCALISRWIPVKIVSCSEKACTIHEDLGYAAEKFVIIPNGFDLGDYRSDPVAGVNLRAELNIEPADPLIGMVARYNPQKDHANFVQAARIYHQAFPQTHFVLCGEGLTWDNAAIVAEIEAAGLRDRFHLLGRRDDMPSVFSALTLHTLSSAYGEAFPNVLGEAMACSVPCVATDVGDSSFLIGDTGMVIPPRDPQALAAAWERLMNLSQEERLALGERARQRVQQLFSIVQIAQRYQDLYKQVIDCGAD